MDTIEFPDEFEEFRARASSGGSLFGLLRRDAHARRTASPDELMPPPPRQRSRSLVPRSAPLETDQDMLRALYDYGRAAEAIEEAGVSRRDPLDLSVTSARLSAAANRTPSLRDDDCCSVGSKHRDRGFSLPVIISSHVDRDTLKPPELFSISSSRESLSYRRRSFSTTPKGIKNDGDLLVSGMLSMGSSIGSDLHIDANGRSRASSSNSQESCSANPSDTPVYKVLMLGGPGVGKTALTQQFMTSEYIGAQNTSFDTSLEASIPVQLDGEESVLDCIDVPYTGDPDMWAQYDVDAFVVVYSITDRRSFQKAADLLDAIRSVGDSRVATILVANKSDLVRSRIVGEKEGKLTAEEFDAKYTEVSAVLNHKVDHLLAGVLKQIRLIKAKQRRESKKRAKEREVAKCLSRARQHLLGTCFKPLRGTSKSCENLLAL